MKLKHLLLLTILSHTALVWGQEKSNEKIPEKMQSHYIFDHGENKEGFVEIKGYKAFERIDEKNQRWTGLNYAKGVGPIGSISAEALEVEKQAGRAVLKANFTLNVNREELQPDGSVRKVTLEHMGNGSAIVVGKNYVLTNFHVLDVLKKDKEPSECPGGWLSSGEDPELKVQCKSVIACGDPIQKITRQSATDPSKTETFFIDNHDDWCLIEVTPTPSGREIGDEVTPLKLAKNSLSQKQAQKVATIGNPGGKGIQASWGMSKPQTNGSSKVINSSAFALSGNSGGAMINSRGRLVGLVYSSDYYDVASATALTTDHLLSRMSGKIPDDIMAEIQEDSDLTQSELSECRSQLNPEAELKEPRRLSRWFSKAKSFIKNKIKRQ